MPIFDHALLLLLCEQPPPEPGSYGEWMIAPVGGGANNRLLRASGPQGDYALKYMRNDARDRAGREYAALQALQQALPSQTTPLAPAPILLERNLPNPLVIQSWLQGDVLTAPPEHDSDWLQLVEHYAALQQICPEATTIAVQHSSWNASSVGEGRAVVHNHLELLPTHTISPSLLKLVARLDAWQAPDWPTPHPALCRTDANFRNFISRPGCWASVDWENSGWGDPAFEIADLITHAAYLGVPDWRWAWVRDRYAEFTCDSGVCQRIDCYVVILLVWWIVRLERYRYELPRGLDTRLAALPENWEAEVLVKQHHYWEAADAALCGVGA